MEGTDLPSRDEGEAGVNARLWRAERRELGLEDDAVDQIFRRMAFNVMGRNCDDHTKNFSFILRQGQPWNLSPAYDVTHAYNPKGEWTYQHLMSVNQKFKGISKLDLLEVANRFGVRRPENILSDVRSAIDNWPLFAKTANLTPTLQKRVASDLLQQ